VDNAVLAGDRAVDVVVWMEIAFYS
jgi:hypothetical protein